MPIVQVTTSGEGESTAVNKDLGSSVSGPGGVTIVDGIYTINPGIFTGTISYEVVNQGAIGSGYFANGASSATLHSSVALYTRSSGYISQNSSSIVASNCVASLCKYAGFAANNNSIIDANLCMSAITSSSYVAQYGGDIRANKCVSIFPWSYAVNAFNSSSVSLNDFETMTYLYSNDARSSIPIHFRSAYDSYVTNSNNSFTTMSSNVGGIQGSAINSANIAFVWSAINQSYRTQNGGIVGTNIPAVGVTLGNPIPLASYQWAPYVQSIDYANIIPTNSSFNANFNNLGLFKLLQFERKNYTSVKPAFTMYRPENGSGAPQYLSSIGMGAGFDTLTTNTNLIMINLLNTTLY